MRFALRCGGFMAPTTQPDWDDVFMVAALQPERWPMALDQMASHTRSFCGQLIGIGGARDVPFNIVSQLSQLSQEALAEFVAVGGGDPAVNYRIAAFGSALERGEYDTILHEQHYDAALPLLRSDAYVQLAEKHDFPFGCQTNLVVDKVGVVGLAVLRHRKEGRTSQRDRAIFAKASVAARRAVRLQERLEGEQARLLAGAFEAISKAAFILDARGRVQAMTQTAEELVATGAVTLRGGYLEGRGTPFSLGQAVGALVAEGGMAHIRLRLDGDARLRLDGDDAPHAPLFMEGFRLPEKPWSIGHLPHAILLVNAPQRDRAGVAAFLGLLYRLTAAEADIAMRLFDGTGRAAIASLRKVTAETLRGQIKAICAKTGTSNEPDLMRLLAAIMS
jgi:DNA-binding CsgD family transcriptional regulator/PAS domain-containing protein